MASDPHRPDDSEPAIEDLTVTEHPDNILARYVRVETDQPAVIEVESVLGNETIRTQQSTARSLEHELLVLGLLPDRAHELVVRVRAGGEMTTARRTVRTAPLPGDVPPLHVRTCDPERTADGYRLLSLVRWERTAEPTHRPDRDWGMALAVDSRGRIVWYYRADHPIWGATATPWGTIVYNAAPHGVVEIDAAGEVLNEWSAAGDLGRRLDAGTFGVHHGVFPLESGHLLALSTEKRPVVGFRRPGDATNVVGDVALEFDRNGDVLDSWSMFEVLDDYRTRKREGSTGGYWDREYGERVDDWTHGNAVLPGDTPGTLMASLRHQDWIVKWDRRTGELIWRLGPEGDFEFPEGADGEWFYHQHSPVWLENGDLLVYDNGNNRPTATRGEPPRTRVAAYRIDDSDVDRATGATGTIREVWSYEYPRRLYAPYVGDLAELPDGNILIGDGGLLEHPEACADDDRTGSAIRLQNNQKWARLLELDRNTPDEKLLEIRIRDQSGERPRSYTMQGSRFVRSL